MQATRMIMRSSNICESFVPNSVYTQCIRWKRKPIWLPPGKTKLFRIPKRIVIPIEEANELKRLYNIYRTCMSSLRSHLETVHTEINVELDEEKHDEIDEEEDFQKCKAINDRWNESVAKVREIRLMAESEASKEEILQKIMRMEEEKEEMRKQIDEEIKKIKEVADTFITAENIDDAIEKCLANVVDHNRALDLNGNWYDGKYPPAPAVEKIATQPTVQQ